jgi:hypothetical protein
MKIGMLVFEDMTQLDFTGPQDCRTDGLETPWNDRSL